MTIRYRNGTTGDAEAIASLYERCFTDTFGHLYRAEDLSDFLSAMSATRFSTELADGRFRFRVAEADGALAGYIKLGPPKLPVATPPDTIELNQLYILKPWQGTGVAARLMEWALETARTVGARHVQLSVYVDNHRARRFYERYGFGLAGHFQFMVGNHADDELVLRHMVLDREP